MLLYNIYRSTFMELAQNSNEKSLLRMKHLTEKLSLSKSTIWLWIRNNEFPKPKKINGVAVWHKDTVEDWIKENTGGDNEIRNDTL